MNLGYSKYQMSVVWRLNSDMWVGLGRCESVEHAWEGFRKMWRRFNYDIHVYLRYWTLLFVHMRWTHPPHAGDKWCVMCRFIMVTVAGCQLTLWRQKSADALDTTVDLCWHSKHEKLNTSQAIPWTQVCWHSEHKSVNILDTSHLTL